MADWFLFEGGCHDVIELVVLLSIILTASLFERRTVQRRVKLAIEKPREKERTAAYLDGLPSVSWWWLIALFGWLIVSNTVDEPLCTFMVDWVSADLDS